MNTYYLTFASSNPKGNGWEEVKANSYAEARAIVVQHYGTSWAFLYDDQNFKQNFFPQGCLCVLNDQPLPTPPDGGMYALNCAEAKHEMTVLLDSIVDEVMFVFQQSDHQLQDDWDDALIATNKKLKEAKQKITEARKLLKEGV